MCLLAAAPSDHGSNMKRSSIVDIHGRPMSHVGVPRPYVGADQASQELSLWNPALGSPSSDYLQDRDTIVARQRDLVRNSGWASGALARHLDNVIGSGFRLSLKPDYRALGLSAEWAKEFAQEVEGRWRLFAEDPENWIDASRHNNFNGLLGLAFRHDFVDGEAIALALWNEDKPYGRYATTIQMIDPDRLSNPGRTTDTPIMRGGVEIDAYGAPVAYHFRKSHPADWAFSYDSFVWERVERIHPWGRRQVLHSFQKERTDQVRGISMLAPIIERLKMIDKYDKTELQAALVNAVLAAFIESPFDHEMMESVLDNKAGGGIGSYQNLRKDFHTERGPKLQGVQIPTLFPGEKLNFQTAARPASQFGAFEKACLHNIAAGVNLSYEQLSQDWSSTNYSSARAALLEVWKSFTRNRNRFADQFATPVFLLWLEEAIEERGDIKLPPGAPDYYTAVAAYGRVKWIGAPRGWVDPVKEVQAAQFRMDVGISTLEDECADQGKDWEEVALQRKRELEFFDEHGLPRPKWADAGPQETNSMTENNAHG